MDVWMMQLERAVVRWVQQAGVGIRISSRDRTFEQQERLYCERRNTSVPAAPPGRSQHEWGFAFDAVPQERDLRKFGVSLREGFKWVGQVAAVYGAHYIVESDHVHIQAFPSAEWSAYLDSLGSINPMTGEYEPSLWRQPRCAAALVPAPRPGAPPPLAGGRPPGTTPSYVPPTVDVPPGVAPPGVCVPGLQIFGIPGAYWTDCR